MQEKAMLQTDIIYVSYSTSIFPKDIHVVGGIWHFLEKSCKRRKVMHALSENL